MSFDAFEAVLRELCERQVEFGKLFAAWRAAEVEASGAKAALAKAQQSQLKTPITLADFPFVNLMDVAWLACLKGSKVEAIKALRHADTTLSLTAAKAVVDAFVALGSPNVDKLALLAGEARVFQDRFNHNSAEITRAVAELGARLAKQSA